MLNCARIITEQGLLCNIKSLQEIRQEQTATAVLKLVGWVASSCDPLCGQVSTGIATALLLSGGPGQHVYQGGVPQEGQGRECLKTLLQNDLKLPFQFMEVWQLVLLTLLAVMNFKVAIANVYCDTHRE